MTGVLGHAVELVAVHGPTHRPVCRQHCTGGVCQQTQAGGVS